MRTAHLGPAGTFSHEAVVASRRAEGDELVPAGSVYDAVMAVERGEVDRALVPVENSIEGPVTVTLDTLVAEAGSVAITGELVHPVSLALIAREALPLDQIEEVVTHPQPAGQCARFLRRRLPRAKLLLASSTAEAVRRVTAEAGASAALGTEIAASIYGGRVLERDVEDVKDNATRFVWLSRGPADPAGGGGAGPWKSTVVFWGAGTGAAGWLVRCLSEFAFRGVNLTRIESRPRRESLGDYMFFVDLDGRAADPPVAAALEALASHAAEVRHLGSYPAAAAGPPG